MTPSPAIRIASWPPWYTGNQYLPLFYRALAARGIEHVANVPFEWRALRQAGVSALHLHWPEPLWREGRQWPGARIGRLARLGFRLRALERAGIPLLWTVHNLEPHEGGGPTDRAALRQLHRRAALRVFHSAWAEGIAQIRWPDARGPTLVMPHGNYDGVLPAPRPRDRVLAEAGVMSKAPVLLCVGQVRAYKGFDVAVAASERLPTPSRLVIAGRPVGAAIDGLRHLAAGRSDVLLIPRDLSDQELADWFGAADVVLLPYHRSSGSGVLLHALTCGRSVVASDLPPFREVAAPRPDAVAFVRAGDPDALARGIGRMLARPAEERRRAARALADCYPWETLVRPLSEWLQAALGPAGDTRPPARPARA